MTEKGGEQPVETSTNFIEGTDSRLLALAWQNYKKKLENGLPEKEAQEDLMQELQGCAGKQAGDNVHGLLYQPPEISVKELKMFLDFGLTGSRRPANRLEAERLYNEYFDKKRRLEFILVPFKPLTEAQKTFLTKYRTFEEKWGRILDPVLSFKNEEVYRRATAELEEFEKEAVTLFGKGH